MLYEVITEPAAIAAAVRKFFDSGMKPGCVGRIGQVKREESWQNFAGRLTAFAESL